MKIVEHAEQRSSNSVIFPSKINVQYALYQMVSKITTSCLYAQWILNLLTHAYVDSHPLKCLFYAHYKCRTSHICPYPCSKITLQEEKNCQKWVNHRYFIRMT